jgi:hypothetical protein
LPDYTAKMRGIRRDQRGAEIPQGKCASWQRFKE